MNEKEPLMRGHAGGLKGGRARAEKLTPKQRKEISRKALRARWILKRYGLSVVTLRGQVTLPIEIRNELGIEPGDLIEARVDGNRIVLVPKLLIDKSQADFWAKQRQADEEKATADIEAGRLRVFKSTDVLGTTAIEERKERE